MLFGQSDSPSSAQFAKRFLSAMQDKNSLSFLDEKEHLSSRDNLANWMCVHHNVIKIEKLHPGFDGLTRDQAQKVYD